MTKKITSRTRGAAAVFALAGLLAGGISLRAQQAVTQQDNTVSGITKPSVHAKLGLNQLGVVLDLPVKEGDHVTKGQLLLQQDARQEQAALEAMELEANSDVRIEASKADAEVKRIQLKRYQDLAAKGSSNPSEVEEAQVKVVYADAQTKLAQLEQQQNKLKAKGQGVKVEQMKIVSPVDGFVESIDVSVGEVTDPQKPCMSVVQNDPLWVEFYLPTTQSLKLKVGQSMDVKYDGEGQWSAAKLIYRAPVADAASGMQKLRLELKNAENKDTGLQVQVKLPAELGPAAAPNPAGAAAAAEPAGAQGTR